MSKKIKSEALVYQQGKWRIDEIEITVRSMKEQRQERKKAIEAIRKRMRQGK